MPPSAEATLADGGQGMAGDTRTAVLDRIRDLPEVARLYEFAVVVNAGHDQDHIVNVLFQLAKEGAVELLTGNRLRRKNLPNM